MDENTTQSEYMRIAEAARYLGVTARTVYRRIWNHDLPAAKLGGLYFIRREDLDGLLRGGPVEEPSPAAQIPLLKCGACYRLIRSDSQIGEVCRSESCEEIICVQCNKEGVFHCKRHIPSRDILWKKAQESLQLGEIPVLVRSSTARLRELNYLERIRMRVERINSLIHPITDEVLTVDHWEPLLEVGDDRAQVMRLLGKAMLDADVVASTPLNAFIKYGLPISRKQKGSPLNILVQIVSRLPEMLRDGFDTQPLGVENLIPWLVRLSNNGERAPSAQLVVLASPTGWYPAACQVVQGGDNDMPYASSQLLIYLFDLEKGKLIYNQQDGRLQRYAELFTSLMPSEELDKVARDVEAQLVGFETLTLETAARQLPYPREVIIQTFKRLEATHQYRLIEDSEFGTTLVRGSVY